MELLAGGLSVLRGLVPGRCHRLRVLARRDAAAAAARVSAPVRRDGRTWRSRCVTRISRRVPLPRATLWPRRAAALIPGSIPGLWLGVARARRRWPSRRSSSAPGVVVMVARRACSGARRRRAAAAAAARARPSRPGSPAASSARRRRSTASPRCCCSRATRPRRAASSRTSRSTSSRRTRSGC